MSQRIGYYPGCSGSGTSVEYDASTRAVCDRLGLSLQDVPDWSCCGSTPAHTVDHVLSAALSARNLELAAQAGLDTVTTPCPSCLANLRVAGHKMEKEGFRKQVKNLLDTECESLAEVKSTLQVLLEDVGPEAVQAKVVRPLSKLRVVCYYGCIMNRPPEVMQFDDPEHPMAMDTLMEACGAEVLPFPLKVECCGAAAGMPRKDIVTELSGRLLDVAAGMGADAIVTACPLCQMNLDLRQGQVNSARGSKHAIPVFYFTQLMGLAMGLSASEMGIAKLAVNPKPCLEQAGVL
ncbi:CoB--CoM heterodisulfide reductase iron-sulfur subunit B family protein [Desulfovibrio subterraneus]|jgi:heterodisulfide reductase subunit B|uniref:Heterodisulfide reductase subunit B n=1 Tax=Desulfovibrio subterraneus TaxID=2718620 RepID=A0A7J0BHG8_9BACT|nr:CoB--CoM heterodisulfide reductase iron-sulfur subunit B family protein [Desulfovibrio subterraneus]GFM33126.1 heterodisulfide reductase subunit B [Desulfovibrio subterraneus]